MLEQSTVDPALSVAVVARRLHVCDRTARRIIKAGDLKAHRIRRQWRVFEGDFQAYLADRTNRREAAEVQT
jgi:excisionase family DNA binding protein